MIYIYFNFARRKPRLSWISSWSFCILEFVKYIKESVVYKKDSSFSGLEVHASWNRIKNVNYLFVYSGEFYTSMACGLGPGNACSEASRSYRMAEKLNFAAPKIRIWSHNKAGCSFPRERGGMGQTRSKKPRGSPWGPGRLLHTGRMDGDEDSHCILCWTNARALLEHRLQRICGAQARQKLMGGWGVMALLLPPPACCHRQLPTSPPPKVCQLRIRFYTQNGP